MPNESWKVSVFADINIDAHLETPKNNVDWPSQQNSTLKKIEPLKPEQTNENLAMTQIQNRENWISLVGRQRNSEMRMEYQSGKQTTLSKLKNTILLVIRKIWYPPLITWKKQERRNFKVCIQVPDQGQSKISTWWIHTNKGYSVQTNL